MKNNFILFVVLLLFMTMKLSGQYKKTVANVHFRTLPEFGKNIICTIPKGSPLVEVDMGMDYNPWTVVRYKGHVGFVYSVYLVSKDTMVVDKRVKTYDVLGDLSSRFRLKFESNCSIMIIEGNIIEKSLIFTKKDFIYCKPISV